MTLQQMIIMIRNDGMDLIETHFDIEINVHTDDDLNYYKLTEGASLTMMTH